MLHIDFLLFVNFDWTGPYQSFTVSSCAEVRLHLSEHSLHARHHGCVEGPICGTELLLGNRIHPNLLTQ
jgi:hypothetical protein